MPTDKRSRRGGLAQWLPLAMTATAIAVGIAAWVWSEHQDNDNDVDDDPRHQYLQPDVSSNDKRDSWHRQDGSAHQYDSIEHSSSSTLYARMTNVISRAASPQQFLSDTSKRMAAGVAAVWPGKSLDFRDHERWQEEEQIRAAEALLVEQQSEEQDLEAEVSTQSLAEETVAQMGASGVVDQRQRQEQAQRGVQGRGKNGKRRTIAVVVSSVVPENQDILQAPGRRLLEQLDCHQIIDVASTDLLILIYAPSLKSYPNSLSVPTQSGEPDFEQPQPLYSILEAQAMSIVPHPAHILPFTTPKGYIHLLRHLAPNMVYIQENILEVQDEDSIAQLKGWVGQMVVVTPDGSSSPEAEIQRKGVDIVHDGFELQEHFARHS